MDGQQDESKACERLDEAWRLHHHRYHSPAGLLYAGLLSDPWDQ